MSLDGRRTSPVLAAILTAILGLLGADFAAAEGQL